MAMSVADALEFLTVGGSNYDPVIYRGEQMGADDLEDAEIVDGDPIGFPASQVKIIYWNGKGRKCTGSLYSMVVDRIEPFFGSIR